MLESTARGQATHDPDPGRLPRQERHHRPRQIRCRDGKVTAIGRPMLPQFGNHKLNKRRSRTTSGVNMPKSCPTAGQAAEMDKIQERSRFKGAEVARHFFGVELGLQCDQSIKAENRVVDIAPANPIFEAAIRVLLLQQELANKVGGVPQHFWRESGHLEHFETDAHYPMAGSEHARNQRTLL